MLSATPDPFFNTLQSSDPIANRDTNPQRMILEKIADLIYASRLPSNTDTKIAFPKDLYKPFIKAIMNHPHEYDLVKDQLGLISIEEPKPTQHNKKYPERAHYRLIFTDTKAAINAIPDEILPPMWKNYLHAKLDFYKGYNIKKQTRVDVNRYKYWDDPEHLRGLLYRNPERFEWLFKNNKHRIANYIAPHSKNPLFKIRQNDLVLLCKNKEISLKTNFLKQRGILCIPNLQSFTELKSNNHVIFFKTAVGSLQINKIEQPQSLKSTPEKSPKIAVNEAATDLSTPLNFVNPTPFFPPPPLDKSIQYIPQIDEELFEELSVIGIKLTNS